MHPSQLERALIGCDATHNWLKQVREEWREREREQKGRLNADDVEGQKQIEKGGKLG